MKCWVAVQREIVNDILNEKDEIQELEDVIRVIADIKIAETVRESVNSNNVIDMNTVNLTCNALLENEEEINHKRYIKSLLQKKISNVLFSRPCVEENLRIFIVTSLTKKRLMITPAKLMILLKFLKWQKSYKGLL